VHYPEDDRTREEILSFLATGSDRLRLSILRWRLDALTDTPICATFEALDRAYPGSRFVLTTRQKEPWLESCRYLWEVWLEPHMARLPDDAGVVYMRALHERVYGRTSFDPAAFSRAYDDYHERVREHFRGRPHDLLILDISAGEGWGPLCEFLNLRTPGTQFPWEARQPKSR
jgi:hypothetical protein